MDIQQQLYVHKAVYVLSLGMLLEAHVHAASFHLCLMTSLSVSYQFVCSDGLFFMWIKGNCKIDFDGLWQV